MKRSVIRDDWREKEAPRSWSGVIDAGRTYDKAGVSGRRVSFSLLFTLFRFASLTHSAQWVLCGTAVFRVVLLSVLPLFGTQQPGANNRDAHLEPHQVDLCARRNPSRPACRARQERASRWGNFDEQTDLEELVDTVWGYANMRCVRSQVSLTFVLQYIRRPRLNTALFSFYC